MEGSAVVIFKAAQNFCNARWLRLGLLLYDMKIVLFSVAKSQKAILQIKILTAKTNLIFALCFSLEIMHPLTGLLLK